VAAYSAEIKIYILNSLRLVQLISTVFHRGNSSAFPIWQTCFVNGLPFTSLFRPLNTCPTPGIVLPAITVGLMSPIWTALKNVKRSEFVKKPSPTHREPLRNSRPASSFESTRWRTVENDWTNITRPNSVTSDRVN